MQRARWFELSIDLSGTYTRLWAAILVIDSNKFYKIVWRITFENCSIPSFGANLACSPWEFRWWTANHYYSLALFAETDDTRDLIVPQASLCLFVPLLTPDHGCVLHLLLDLLRSFGGAYRWFAICSEKRRGSRDITRGCVSFVPCSQ